MFSLVLSGRMNAQIIIKRGFYMIIHYVILSIMAALSLVAVYAAAIVQKKTRVEQREARESDQETTDSQ
jgi:hypothetical protein